MAEKRENIKSVEIVDFKVITRVSKNGNEFTGLYAYDDNGKEYFINFVNVR